MADIGHIIASKGKGDLLAKLREIAQKNEAREEESRKSKKDA